MAMRYFERQQGQHAQPQINQAFNVGAKATFYCAVSVNEAVAVPVAADTVML